MALLEHEQTPGFGFRSRYERFVAQGLEFDVHVLRPEGSAPPFAEFVVHGEAQLVGVLVENGAGLPGRFEFRVRVVVVGAVEVQRFNRSPEVDSALAS